MTGRVIGRVAGLMAALLTGCIADRVPTRDDDRLADGWLSDGWLNDGGPLDGPDAGQGTADAAIGDAGAPRCALDFDTPGQPLSVAGHLQRAGDLVWWQALGGGRLAWIDADGGTGEVPTLGGLIRASAHWLVAHDAGARTLDRLDLTTGSVERLASQVRSVIAREGWIAWGAPDGLFVHPPGGAVRRVGDCIRDCTAPRKVGDALWYLGRSRGQVEPALFAEALDGSGHRVFEGPIRDPRITTGGETLWWWTISDPPMGDLGRQIIAAGAVRLGYLTDPMDAAPAWARVAGVAAFYDAARDATVLLDANGRRGALPGVREVLGAGTHFVYRAPDGDAIVFIEASTGDERLSVEGNTVHAVADAPFAEPLIQVSAVAARVQRSRIYRVGERPRLILDVPGHVSRIDWGPAGRRALVLVNLPVGFGVESASWLVDLTTGAGQQLPMAMDHVDAGGWLDAERIYWLDDAGRLVVQRIADEVSVRYGEGFGAVQRLGRGSDGCMRVVLGPGGPDEQPGEARVIPDR